MLKKHATVRCDESHSSCGGFEMGAAVEWAEVHFDFRAVIVWAWGNVDLCNISCCDVVFVDCFSIFVVACQGRVSIWV